jgi:hypothetical protein
MGLLWACSCKEKGMEVWVWWMKLKGAFWMTRVIAA